MFVSYSKGCKSSPTADDLETCLLSNLSCQCMSQSWVSRVNVATWELEHVRLVDLVRETLEKEDFEVSENLCTDDDLAVHEAFADVVGLLELRTGW